LERSGLSNSRVAFFPDECKDSKIVNNKSTTQQSIFDYFALLLLKEIQAHESNILQNKLSF